jgi:hypothetical protein
MTIVSHLCAHSMAALMCDVHAVSALVPIVSHLCAHSMAALMCDAHAVCLR